MGDKVETNKDIRNDELKTAIITLKLQNDAESSQYFVEELKKAYFIIPAEKNEKKDDLDIIVLRDPDGNNFFQAYTDLDAYNKWNNAENATTFVLTFDEYANIIVACDEVKGIVINPFTENISLDKDFIRKVFIMDKIFIDEEKECPTKIKNIFKKVLKKQEKVQKAYLMYIEKMGVPGYLLIIDSKIKNKEKDKLYNAIGADTANYISQINLDILLTTDEIAKDVIKNKKAFYEKK